MTYPLVALVIASCLVALFGLDLWRNPVAWAITFAIGAIILLGTQERNSVACKPEPVAIQKGTRT